MKLRRIGLVAALGIGFLAAPAPAQQIHVPYARGGVAGVPNYYVVNSGDTLSEISEAYFGNPFDWPRIWSFNPQITNPHWIYPGDVIFLRPPADMRDAPSPRPPGEPGTHYPLGGFFTGSELNAVGFIRFSPTPYRTLSLDNDVYVEFEDRESVEIGDRFALNRVVDRIYDDDDELIGVKYIVTGVVEVIEIPAEAPLIVGRIIRASRSILRDDVLFVNQRNMRVVEPRMATADVEARIIDFLQPLTVVADSYYVFIDAGYNSGVREGNRFTIWRRYDEYAEFRDREAGFDEDDHIEDMPWRAMGQALVIFTTNDYSTAVLTHAELEVARGTRVTLTDGY